MSAAGPGSADLRAAVDEDVLDEIDAAPADDAPDDPRLDVLPDPNSSRGGRLDPIAGRPPKHPHLLLLLLGAGSAALQLAPVVPTRVSLAGIVLLSVLGPLWTSVHAARVHAGYAVMASTAVAW